MPSITQSDPPTLASGKKRRREDDCNIQTSRVQQFCGHEHQGILSTIHNERLLFPPGSLYNVSRKVALPISKRHRILDRDDSETRPLHLTSPSTHSHSLSQNHFQGGHRNYSAPPPALAQTSSRQIRPSLTPGRANSSALNPCHICHRKPTKKSDLDSFADCMGCGERACFVCIRECQSWPPLSTVQDDQPPSFTMQDVDDSNHLLADRPVHDQTDEQNRGWNGRGHRQVICSRCCIERGSEGDIVCLGCLAGIEGL